MNLLKQIAEALGLAPRRPTAAMSYEEALRFFKAQVRVYFPNMDATQVAFVDAKAASYLGINFEANILEARAKKLAQDLQSGKSWGYTQFYMQQAATPVV